jgi:Protein of unknown function (DUF1592)/Protein of unknown function (DUF1588)/Protein of unknown function (DUF1595)/Protein of unknown function (DUF1585)/Protein of unknown function (DUF1587)
VLPATVSTWSREHARRILIMGRRDALCSALGGAHHDGMRTVGVTRIGAVACLLVPGLTGCYSGLSGSDSLGGSNSAGESGQSGGADEDGSGGSDGGSDGGVPSCDAPSAGPTSLRRLTSSQYNHAVRDLIGYTGDAAADFSADERIGPFTSNFAAPVSDLQVEQYMAAAEELAVWSIEDIGALLPCDPVADGEDACATQLIAELAPRAYRRPLTADELTGLQGVYQDGVAQGDFANGIRLVVQGLLQSPWFLYHVEFGEDDGASGELVALTDHELAARLSFFLWDSMPDDALFAAAQAGLDDDAALTEQVDRMLADPRARDGVAHFHLQWLGVDEVDKVEKTAEYFPSFDSTLASAMLQETADFSSYVVLDGDGMLSTLLTASYTLSTDADLLALYGVTVPADHVAGEPIPLPADQRSGLLTQASVMTKHAHVNQTSPVHRGKLVRENLLCQPLLPPPPDVDTVPPTPDPDATTRERFEQHRTDPSCSGCHGLIDPLGFAFEHYDGIGAWRAIEAGAPVDASGEITVTDVDREIDGALEMGAAFAESTTVQECVARQWFRFAFGRSETEQDACSTDTLDADFAASGGDVRQVIRTLVLSDAFRHRRPEVAAAPTQEDDR